VDDCGCPPSAAELSSFWSGLGEGLEELILLDREPSTELVSTLAVALPSWVSLRVLQLGTDALSQLSYALPLPQLLGNLPVLESLGQIDCSWQDTCWFFDALGDAPMRALTSLYLYVNSPGAPPTGAETSSWCGGCALSEVSTRVAAAFPSVERLFVEWYDEDAITASQMGGALRGLSRLNALESVHLLRSSDNCGALGAEKKRGGAEERRRLLPSLSKHAAVSIDEQAAFEAALPGVVVRVYHEGIQTAHRHRYEWLLEDSVRMSTACAGLLPVESVA